MKGMYLGRRFYRQMFGLVIECEGVGGSFNGNRHGLDDLTLIAGPARATFHYDMSVVGAQCH